MCVCEGSERSEGRTQLCERVCTQTTLVDACSHALLTLRISLQNNWKKVFFFVSRLIKLKARNITGDLAPRPAVSGHIFVGVETGWVLGAVL